MNSHFAKGIDKHLLIVHDNKGHNCVQIKTIQQPTLVLWGAKDLLIPLENATKFHNDLLTIRSV
jgi:pimeloyl-ACP methyl ester carboxylesterase